MAKAMKKPLSLMLMALLALVLAFPVSAASQEYVFYYEGEYHAHSSSFINGPADVTGNTVTITLAGDYFPYLYADDGNGNYVLASRTVSGGNTTFTFTNSDPSENIPVQLFVSVTYPGGSHNALYDLEIVW
ncbi:MULTISPECIES: hypothetical protein [Cohnella]|uniref:hypothetical protein n=1 Tax=Cohnella TaxID=329857 RepID=UPI0009B9BDA1|nr:MULTISPECIES: hypothetical protein [Cohnella]MBN2981393.1 hypothetical protein [Cohnella algarum]